MGAFFGEIRSGVEVVVKDSVANCSVSATAFEEDSSGFGLLVPSERSGNIGGVLAEGAAFLAENVSASVAGIFYGECGCGLGDCSGAKCERFRARFT